MIDDRNEHVLIVDDDPFVRKIIADHFRDADLRVTTASNRAEMERAMRVEPPDLILLDLRLGADDGLDLLRDVRRHSVTPVIIVTAHRVEEADHVIGLDLGADDYVVKPFRLHELLARARATLRRRRLDSLHPAALPGRIFRFDRWSFDDQHVAVQSDEGDAISLTKTEAALLATLVRQPRRPLTREYLLQATRLHNDAFDRSIDVQILRLRRKLERDPSSPRLIVTQRGRGYVLDVDVLEG